jgi:hypothetical protein
VAERLRVGEKLAPTPEKPAQHQREHFHRCQKILRIVAAAIVASGSMFGALEYQSEIL